MANISDVIEQFLTQLFADSDNVSISRNELANYFSCAPSQINYVLMTRFTPARGYVVESRRGGGGYINLTRLSDNRDKLLDELVNLPVSGGMSYTSALQILKRLCEANILEEDSARLLAAVMSDKALIAPAVVKDGLRAGMMRSLATALLKKEDKQNG